MVRHGIARNYEHAVVDRAADGSSVTFELRDSAETRAAYPYSFKLNMTYAITGEATLSQTFHVTNTGDATLPFCVGGHPAFNVPMGASSQVAGAPRGMLAPPRLRRATKRALLQAKRTVLRALPVRGSPLRSTRRSRITSSSSPDPGAARCR